MGVEKYSDEEIVKGCKSDDSKMQEVLYNQYATRMISVCSRYTNDRMEAEDILGVKHIIGFTRPEVKEVYITIDIDKGTSYPGDTVVKRAILNYIGGQDEDGIIYKGLRLGDDVIISRIMATATCLGGINDINVSVSLNGDDFASENIEVGKREIAQTNFDKVVINYV